MKAPLFFRGANAAIAVFDLTSSQSFQELRGWIEDIRQHAPECTGIHDQILINQFNHVLVIYVVGNKVDLAPDQRVISTKTGEEFLQSFSGLVQYTEVSALSNIGKIHLFLIA